MGTHGFGISTFRADFKHKSSLDPLPVARQGPAMQIGDRISSARTAAGWSQKKLGDAVGQGQTTISSWERGRTEPSREDVQRIASALGIDVAHLEAPGAVAAAAPARHAPPELREVGRPVDLATLRSLISEIESRPASTPREMRLKTIDRRVPVVGEVAAGVWRETVSKSLDEVVDYLPIDVLGYERADLRAYRVVGPSMNLVYPEGRFVVVAHPAEAGLRVGDYVIVERHRGSDLVEITLKEFSATVDGAIELWPRSSHPEFQEPIRLNDRGEGDQTMPQIIGVVVADYGRRERPPIAFEPRSR
jgi:transcriptional regulator with XRE-family HTH domain